MTLKEDLVHEIGTLLYRAARASGAEWDYAGRMFETRDGVSSSGTTFQFHGRTLLDFDMPRDDRLRLTDAFKQLREATRVDGDNYWIKCLVVVRNDGDMRMLFEFRDGKRWSIGPANVDRAFDVLVGEIYPEALQAN
jgi:hypothetical protein